MPILKKWIPNDALRNVVEWILVFAAAALLAFIMNTFLFRTANVTGDSMMPTLAHGDVVLMDRLSLRFGEPQYDDIVVFPYAGDPSEYYIKRVVGLPGDVMDWLDGAFLRNNEPLDDPFSLAETRPGTVAFPLTVPEGTCFVLGDNRNVSDDSRYEAVGCIPFEKLTGKVALRVWPLSKFGSVSSD